MSGLTTCLTLLYVWVITASLEEITVQRGCAPNDSIIKFFT